MEQPLPCDPEAEKSFLASLSAPGNDDEAYLCLPLVDADDFVVPHHRSIYSALVELSDQRTEISSLTLKHALEGKHNAPHFTELLEILGSEEVGRPKVLAEILRKHTLNRKIIKIGGHLVQEGFRNLEPHEIASRCTEALRKLEHNRKGRVCASRIMERLEAGEAFADPGTEGQNLKWGLPFLTENIEASPGHVIVIGARPKCGKSALAVQAICESARVGIKSLFVSLEMDANEVESRVAAQLTAISHTDFRKNLYGDQAVYGMREHSQVISNIYTWPRPSGILINEIEVEIRDAVRRDGVRLVVVDYLQLIGYSTSKTQTEASAIGANMNALKRLAQELKITILVLVQVNRDGGDRDEPTSRDLKGSGDLEQTGNAIVLLWKDKHDVLHIKISDNRSGPAGFKQPVDFDGATNRFRAQVRETNPPTPTTSITMNGARLVAAVKHKRDLYD